MLREASLSEMKKKDIPKERRVLVNRGRGNDKLAPADDLFRDFIAQRTELEESLGRGAEEAHNRAFLTSHYANRFRKQVLEDAAAMAKLEELARRATSEDLYLVCYEGPTKACHRRLLLRLAEERFGAPVEVSGVEPA